VVDHHIYFPPPTFNRLATFAFLHFPLGPVRFRSIFTRLLPSDMKLPSLRKQQDLNLLASILFSSRPVCTSCARSRRHGQDSPQTQPSSQRSFSILNRPPPNYPGHVPLTSVERVGLAVGSAVTSLLDPYRHDMVAALGEATAQPFFISWLRRRMLSDPTGRRILRDRPRITSKTMSLEMLRKLPENSVGRIYAAWLDREGVTPDTRDSVRYIDDEEEAYVMQRYRESHDFYHAVTGMPVWTEGELGIKAFEFANTGLPMTGLSLAAMVRLKPVERQRMFQIFLPWGFSNGWKSKDLINVYWEEELETDVRELRARLGIEQPPDLRDIRKKLREERRAAKAAREAGAVKV
jgi:ubiquinone biosynthesis protein COQ4